MRRSGWHDWRLRLGVLLTLLVCGGVAPQTRAGCEQPTSVMWSNEGTSRLALADFTSRAMPNSLFHHSVPRPQPCKGPQCSQAPLVPLAPPATLMETSQEWGCLPVVPGNPEPQGAAYRLEDDPHKPIFKTFRIYHPPR